MVNSCSYSRLKSTARQTADVHFTFYLPSVRLHLLYSGADITLLQMSTPEVRRMLHLLSDCLQTTNDATPLNPAVRLPFPDQLMVPQVIPCITFSIVLALIMEQG